MSADRLILGFDTATPQTAVATAIGGEVTERSLDPVDGRPLHGTRLLATIEELVTAAGGWGEVGLIAVGVGPGSFTGLRIGVATARALAQSRSLAVVAVPSTGALLAAIADTPQATRRPRLALVDARRGEVFAALAPAPGRGGADLPRPEGKIGATGSGPHDASPAAGGASSVRRDASPAAGGASSVRRDASPAAGGASPAAGGASSAPRDASPAAGGAAPAPGDAVPVVELAAAEPIVCAPGELSARYGSEALASAVAAGDGAVRFRAEIEAAGALVLADGDDAHRLSASRICELGAALEPVDPERIRPMYLRRPDAERWRERDGSN